MSPFTAVVLALAVAQPPSQPESPPAAAPAEGRPPQAVPAQRPASPLPVITLDEALRIAAERNLDLQVANARLKQADELSWKAWSAYLPQLNVTSLYTRSQFDATITLPTGYAVRGRVGGPDEPPPDPAGLPGTDTNQFITPTGLQSVTIQDVNQYSAQAELTQALIAPQLWFLIPNAHRGERVAALTVEAARRDVLFGVAAAYYGVAALRQALEVAERLLEIAQRQEKDARVRFQAGSIAKVGLVRAEIDRARAEQDVRRSRNSYESGRISLATLLDRPVDFEVADPPEPQLPPDLGALEEAAVRDRPEVQASRVQVDIARGARGAAWARYLPNVGAYGRYLWSNSGGFTGENAQWLAGFSLQWNILDGGRRESDIREAGWRVVEARASAAGAELRVREEVRLAVLDLESARANALKSKEQRDLAAENLRLVDVSYRAGAATAVELADATAALRNAEIGFATETLNAQVAALRVLRAAGLFDPVPPR